ncbi:MAG TPA: CDP-alcohol phosphatidyltransferase family protein [Nitrospira sp.]|nr:CDP-alcohol phosphatidyltransferase family protein [Nitrospira sp.]
MRNPILDDGTEVQGLSTALLFPSIDLFGPPLPKSVGPLTSIVGVTLFQRTVLTLQRAGIRQLIVLSGPDEDELKQALLRGPRVTVPVRWMPIREFPLNDARTWESLAAEVPGFCLLSGVGAVFSRPLIEELRRDVRGGQVIVVGHSTRNNNGSDTAEHGWGPDASGGSPDVVVMQASELSIAGRLAAESNTMPITRWLNRAVSEGRVRLLPNRGNDPSSWCQPVCNDLDLRQAERRLYSSLKGEFEGLVDRYFNRKLSRWCTRAFVAFGWSPNAVTITATAIGLLAAAGFAFGTYAAGVAAALLFQLAAVIDCSDGEVARLTFTESPFGAWLDLALDNVVHMAIFTGIAIGAFRQSAGGEGAWIPLALGSAAVLGNALSFLLVNKAQKVKATSEWKTPLHAAWSDFMLKNLASRDFSVVVLVFALVGQLEVFLWLAAIGSLVFTGLMAWILRPAAVARPCL